jgi:hypothetical protein
MDLLACVLQTRKKVDFKIQRGCNQKTKETKNLRISRKNLKMSFETAKLNSICNKQAIYCSGRLKSHLL